MCHWIITLSKDGNIKSLQFQFIRFLEGNIFMLDSSLKILVQKYKNNIYVPLQITYVT